MLAPIPGPVSTPLGRWLRAVGKALPEGSALPQAVWARRHRGILTLLWLHVPAVWLFALLRGVGPVHATFETSIVVAIAAIAQCARANQRVATVSTAVGLLTCSAILVHLSGGLVEMHFHFFVMVGVVTLYQDWWPFLAAIGYVVVQHGVAGAVSPAEVFNHPAAIAHPWRWAAVHGGFILAMSAAGIISWKLNEALLVAARDRELRLAEAQQVARLGSWEWDLRTDEVTWSDEMYRLGGSRPGSFEPTRATMLDRLRPEDRADVEARLHTTAETGLPAALDFCIGSVTGPDRWMHGRWTVTEWADGRPAVVAGTTQDVTERRAAEAALRDSEERFRAVTETASDAIITADAEGTIVSLNGQAQLLFGVNAAEAVGSELTMLMPERFRAGHRAGIARLREHGSSRLAGRTVELIGLHRDGTEFPLELSFGSFEAGGATFFTGIMRDITERARAQEEQSATLSLLAATLDSTADGILVVDREGRITSFNRQFGEMWRIPVSILDARDDEAAIAHVVDQVADPESFVAKVRELYSQPDSESHDTITFGDGRCFERYSKPQLVAGEIVGRVWSFRDVTDRKRLEDELAHQAFHDPLTGLANKALFRDRVQHALTRSARAGNEIAVLFVDLDHFKTVNDSLGHTAGDELLAVIASRISAAVRDSDTAARLGGDEFAVLVEDTEGRHDVLAVVDRMLASVQRPATVGGKELAVSASIGIAFSVAGSTVDKLLANADLAMYTAKAHGRNRFETFEVGMHVAAVEHLELANDLRRACERGEIVVHYQPIVRLEDEQTVAVEALVRWDHPVRGLVGPAAFVRVAEETGLIDQLGRLVLHETCRQLRAWQDAGVSLSASVNLSAHQLADAGLVADVADTLAAYQVQPSRLTLELTESALMENTDRTISVLRELKALGVRLAVDDFGTGYSSLSYLQHFPIDVLKIDRTFVADITDGSVERSLAQAIVSLAASLQLTAVAEGIETATQAGVLRQLGCELGQGFHFSPPVAPEEITAMVTSPGAVTSGA